GVPVVGSGDRNDVHRFIGQDFAEIPNGLYAVEAQLLDLGFGSFQCRLVNIADRDDLESRHLGGVADIPRSHAPYADESDVDLVVGAPNLAWKERRGERGGPRSP